MSIKVAITDDHPLAVNGVKSMLAAYPQIEVVADYNSGTTLMEGLAIQQPDVLLLDILLPDKSGRELAPLIAKTYPDVRIVALSSLDVPIIIKHMMTHGCLGYLLKDSSQETMVAAIEHAYNGEEFIEPALKEHLLKNMKNRPESSSSIPNLTQREKEILQLIVSELTSQEIADKLFISFRTAETHRYSLLQKLGVKNTAGLVKAAITMGLID